MIAEYDWLEGMFTNNKTTFFQLVSETPWIYMYTQALKRELNLNAWNLWKIILLAIYQ